MTIGGAFCTALLLKQCWSPAYTIESVIVQMAALLVKGNGRICFDSPIKVGIKPNNKMKSFKIITWTLNRGILTNEIYLQYSLSTAKNTFDGVMSRKPTGEL